MIEIVEVGGMGMVRRATLAGFDDQGNPIVLEVSSMTYEWFMQAKRKLRRTNSELLRKIHAVNRRKTVRERDVITFVRELGIPQPRE